MQIFFYCLLLAENWQYNITQFNNVWKKFVPEGQCYSESLTKLIILFRTQRRGVVTFRCSILRFSVLLYLLSHVYVVTFTVCDYKEIIPPCSKSMHKFHLRKRRNITSTRGVLTCFTTVIRRNIWRLLQEPQPRTPTHSISV